MLSFSLANDAQNITDNFIVQKWRIIQRETKAFSHLYLPHWCTRILIRKTVLPMQVLHA